MNDGRRSTCPSVRASSRLVTGFGAVMFTDADEIDPGLVSQHRLIQQIADHLCMAVQAATGAGSDIAKGIKSKLKGHGKGPVMTAVPT